MKKKNKALLQARARLVEWGRCVRSVAASGGPGPTAYSKQPFTNERINFDFSQANREAFVGRRFDRAIEVDEWLQSIKDHHASAYTALIVRYVEREYGGFRKLTHKEQFYQFYRLTSLGKTAYYRRLTMAEKFIAMRLKGST